MSGKLLGMVGRIRALLAVGRTACFAFVMFVCALLAWRFAFGRSWSEAVGGAVMTAVIVGGVDLVAIWCQRRSVTARPGRTGDDQGSA